MLSSVLACIRDLKLAHRLANEKPAHATCMLCQSSYCVQLLLFESAVTATLLMKYFGSVRFLMF